MIAGLVITSWGSTCTTWAATAPGTRLAARPRRRAQEPEDCEVGNLLNIQAPHLMGPSHLPAQYETFI